MVCLGVECGLPEMMGYYLGFGSDEFVFRLGSNYERHLMAAYRIWVLLTMGSH